MAQSLTVIGIEAVEQFFLTNQSYFTEFHLRICNAVSSQNLLLK